MAHTPGPWTIRVDKHLDERQINVIDREGYYVAEAFGGGKMDLATEDNACLIAAAPDTTDALESLVLFVDSLLKASAEQQVRMLEIEWTQGNRMFAARAALAKARGEA